MAFTHHPKSGTTVSSSEMAEHFDDWQSQVDRVVSGYGIVTSGASLTLTTQTGRAFVSGYKVGEPGDSDDSQPLTPSTTNHVFLSKFGVITINTSGVPPADTIKLYEVDTNGTGVTATRQFHSALVHLLADLKAATLESVAEVTTGTSFVLGTNVLGGSGSAFIDFGGQAKLYTSAASTVSVLGTFQAESTSGSTYALLGRVTTDSVARMAVRIDGQFEWGTGSAARDTFFERAGAGVLRLSGITPVLILRDTDNAAATQIGYISLQDNTSSERAWMGFGNANGDLGIVNINVASVVITTNAKSVVLNSAGQLQVPTTGSSAGLMLGGDAQVWRSAANNLTVTNALGLAGATPSGRYILMDDSANSRGFSLGLLTGGRSGSGFPSVGYNVAFTTGSTYTYAVSDFASQVFFQSGNIIFQTAPSGSAAATITFTEAGRFVQSTGQFQIAAVGANAGLLIGGDAKLYRVGATSLETTGQFSILNPSVFNGLIITRAAASDVGFSLLQSSVVQWDILNPASTGTLRFRTGGGTWMELSNAGQLSLPTTGSSGGIVLSDVQWFRGAANRMDLASGDSLNVVSGSATVTEAGTGAGEGGIIAATATAGGNAGFQFATNATTRASISLLGSAGVEALRFRVGISSSPITGMQLSSVGQLALPTSGSTGGLLIGGDFQWWRTGSASGRTDALLGIGRDAADYQLDVSRNNGHVARFTSTATNSVTDVLIVDQDNTFNRAALQIQGNAGATEVAFFGSTGRVGLGTTSPTSILHLYSVGPVLTLQDSDSAAATQIGYISLQDSGSVERGWMGFGNGNGDLGITNTNAASIVLATNAKSAVLNSSGQWQLPTTGSSAGIMLGGDAQVWRSGTNNLTITNALGLLGATPSGRYIIMDGSPASYGFSIGSLQGGHSAGDYPSIGYGLGFTTSGNSYTYAYSDTANAIRFSAGNFLFLTAAAGVAGNAITFTEVAALTAAGMLQLAIQGSAGGIRIGGDTFLYRDAADVMRTPGVIRGDDAPTNAADLTRKDYVDAIGPYGRASQGANSTPAAAESIFHWQLGASVVETASPRSLLVTTGSNGVQTVADTRFVLDDNVSNAVAGDGTAWNNGDKLEVVLYLRSQDLGTLTTNQLMGICFTAGDVPEYNTTGNTERIMVGVDASLHVWLVTGTGAAHTATDSGFVATDDTYFKVVFTFIKNTSVVMTVNGGNTVTHTQASHNLPTAISTAHAGHGTATNTATKTMQVASSSAWRMSPA